MDTVDNPLHETHRDDLESILIGLSAAAALPR
jgi:hypothetical protein